MIATLEMYQMSRKDSDSLGKDSVSHAVPHHTAECRCCSIARHQCPVRKIDKKKKKHD